MGGRLSRNNKKYNKVSNLLFINKFCLFKLKFEIDKKMGCLVNSSTSLETDVDLLKKDVKTLKNDMESLRKDMNNKFDKIDLTLQLLLQRTSHLVSNPINPENLRDSRDLNNTRADGREAINAPSGQVLRNNYLSNSENEELKNDS